MRSDTADYLDGFEDFELDIERHLRSRKRKPLPSKPKMRAAVARAQLADEEDEVAEIVPTYAAALDPLHFERQWISSSLGSFYRDNLISDVTRLVKGGKEANVYCCLGSPRAEVALIAAKLYRPRMLRHLKNDALYKAGRQLRDSEGKQIKGRRVKLALRKKSKFGKKVDIEWWIGNEFRVQSLLYAAGADVPKPLAFRGNAILMAFLGDAYMAAPTLSEISLQPSEAEGLFHRIMANVALMLDNHLVHGDLSSYNIIYWEGKITIIDFPQMVDARTNPNAFMLLERDVLRVCQYFERYGVEVDPVSLVLDLWEPYMGRKE